MKKILIVDDERIIRNGLKNSIDWASLGCEVVGLASNGKEGLNLIEVLRPDIVLADVKMPEMTGIEMAQNAIAKGIDTQYILITGYSDFETAKQAIKLSAVDFIQKPISDEELILAINKAKHELNVNESYHHYVENETILEIMRGRKSSEELPQSFKKEDFNILLLQVNTNWMGNEHLQAIRKLSKKHFKLSYIELIICHEDILAIIVESNNKLELSLENFKSEFEHLNNLILSVGVSNKGNGNDIERLYKQSKAALDYKIMSGLGKINYFEELEDEKEMTSDLFLDMKKEYRKLVKRGSFQELKTQVQNIFTLMTQLNLTYGNMKAITLDLQFIILNQLMRQDLETNSENSIFLFKENESIKELENRFIDYLETMSALIINLEITHEMDKEIEQFIQSNYQLNIPLSYFAEKHYVSESTISRKIKKIFNASYAEIIMNLRMDEASRLLRETSMSVSEISQQIGYSDYRYFSTLFKKNFNKTPSQFRKQAINF